MYNLIENNDNYLITSGTLWQNFRDEPAINAGNIFDFNAAKATTNSFKVKKETGQTGNDDKKKNYWTFKMSLFNSEIIFDLNWSTAAVTNQGVTFSKTDANLDVSVVTLSTQDNAKQLEQLKSGFKRTINGININQKYPQKE